VDVGNAVRYDVRVFGLTASELVILGAIALVVVGPRNVPAMLREVGKLVGAARADDPARSGRLDMLVGAALLTLAIFLVFAAWMSARR
jgi:uncharacterized membrane protein